MGTGGGVVAELSWWEAIVLGIVQGATEWLPVSSSGHLLIAERLLRVDADGIPLLVLVLHLGTLFAVLVAYWGRLWDMLKCLFPGGDADERRYIGRLIIGTLPIVVVGVAFEEEILDSFESMLTVGLALVFTGLALLSTRWAKPFSGRITWWQALLAGLGQAVAVFPGVSRSGSTITAALHAGMDRQKAADFAFLLSVPALVGALIFQGRDVEGLKGAPWGPLLVGAAASFIVGALTLKWLVGWIKARGLVAFAPYCLCVGVGIIIWSQV